MRLLGCSHRGRGPAPFERQPSTTPRYSRPIEAGVRAEAETDDATGGAGDEAEPTDPRAEPAGGPGRLTTAGRG
ncbi:hypothetical protein HMPREF9062_0840 [Actinomyces sp. oral taxon 448 str. F0400]|nr:hypothetical protein HMPREF9062_0840 [Actinomyces sp. oral taxon 448 str. F0400]